MRFVDYTAHSDATGALSALDGFAELAGGHGATSTIGGFRILRPRPSQLARIRARVLRRTAGMHLRASSSLSVLFIGGLALAVLAGPASCPCDPLHGAPPLMAGGDARDLSRFAYTRASEIEIARAPAARSEAGPLTELAMLDLDETTYGGTASPITTASIPSTNAKDRPLTGLARLGALPERIDEISTLQPEPIRLAAATPVTDVPLLPVIDVVMPVETEADTEVDEPKARRSRAVSKRRHQAAKRTRKARSSDPAVIAAQKYARAPRWAKQMFDNPWQNSAFSYVR